ncbi:glycine zipper 2TM domain-containing protein [Arachidicoccus ginsenosidivorans]|uniref:Glycine zipper 2TM domain-containing protein n=1 Tax=Arachidicoccus ginsenosidivorans TaxID=496057 RepID=A0A5B8VVH6_9BACT|nr:glycine zipper domain-containing protein [Arachidicoccus ginsenosidivorans]QEC74188.1 glycine zipper 2TM domain-containing protein [Arachidicoccus ginsenosidivorans]
MGAGSGAVIGAIVDKKNRGLGAVIGAAVGGGAGYGIGKHKDNKKAKEGQ